jgi:predicted 3-demethylubiquinone-9 3-methyltransferase (glyoxalase superfamily)
MQKLVPCLWFDHQAEEAAKFYTSIFKNSKILTVTHYGEAGAKASGQPKGSVMTVVFQLEGQKFMALNGGPVFTHSPAFSLIVNCQTQADLDRIWEKLSADKASEQCGWLKDKYGVSWQIVPAELEKWLNEKDPARANRVIAALMQMHKLDIKKLKEAYATDTIEVMR